MLREHDTPSHMMPFFLENEDAKDDELAQRLRNREPSETEPAVFLTRVDYDAVISWIFSSNSLLHQHCSTQRVVKTNWMNTGGI